MTGTVDQATAKLTFSQVSPGTYQYNLSLTNTGTAAIQTFWFAWDDVPDTNFMTVSPTSISGPSNWFGIITHNTVGPADGYGIQFYTPISPFDLTGGNTLTGFSFQSTETPAQMFAASPFEPAFQTLSSFVYPTWQPTIGDPNAFNLVVACFAEGTRILTTTGEVPVEILIEGTRVATLQGGLAPVRWLGHRRIDCRRHPKPENVWPIRVREGAFGPGSPVRDLLLSPDHAVYANADFRDERSSLVVPGVLPGVLIPIRYLVNGATIIQERVDSLTYYHVELPCHGVLLAEGLACESYLDTGNRGAFANGGAVVEASPDFAMRVWNTQGCAELVRSGQALAAVKRRLLQRAETLGYTMEFDPLIHLLVDGDFIEGHADGLRHRFILPAGAREVRLVSRTAIPAHVQAHSVDYRRLGAAVEHLVIDGRQIAARDIPCGEGWHDAEAPEATWRWTDGNAKLDCSGARQVEIAILPLVSYWDDLPYSAGIWSRTEAADGVHPN